MQPTCQRRTFLCVIGQNFQMEMGSCSIIFLDSAVRRRRAATARASRRRRTRGRQGDTFGFRCRHVTGRGGSSTPTGHRSLNAAPRPRGPRPSAPRLARVRAPPLGRSAWRRLAASPAPAHRPRSPVCYPPARPVVPGRATLLVTPAEYGHHLSVLSFFLIHLSVLSQQGRKGARTELAWAAPAEAAVDCLVVHGSRALIMGRALDCLLAARWRTII